MYVPYSRQYGCELMIGVEEAGSNETLKGIH